MKLVFYSLSLNHHQAPVADALYEMLGNDFCFVELSSGIDNKGDATNYSTRSYLIKAWQSQYNYKQAMEYALNAEVCVFSGVESLPFEINRLKQNRLSFDMGERLLKRGLINLASPRIIRMVASYYRYGWSNKSLYKLCCSAFAAEDLKALGMFKNKCFKWGYFTFVDRDCEPPTQTDGPYRIMWCGRFLTWKHPELAIELANKLKENGYKFDMDIFGGEFGVAKYDRPYPESELRKMIDSYNLRDVVNLRGQMPNHRIVEEMRNHDIFLFTSDKYEGWGAVANESMASGCALVSSDKIGSTDFLITHGKNGLKFKSKSIDSLTYAVKILLDNDNLLHEIQANAYKVMREQWNPQIAAVRLLQLIDVLQKGTETPFVEGPCSKA